MMDHRIQDTQIVVPSDEPDDGEMADLEEEFRNQQSKKLKICQFSENFKITVRPANQVQQKMMPNFTVFAITDKAAGSSGTQRKFVASNNTIQELVQPSANLQVTIRNGSNNLKEDARQVVQSLSTPIPCPYRELRSATPIPIFPTNYESMLDDDDDDFDYGGFTTLDEDALLN